MSAGIAVTGTDDDLDTVLMDALVQASFTVIGVVSTVAARHDLSLTMMRVAAIASDHDLTMSELAAYLGLDRSTVTGLIDRAVKRGLVRRSGNENDRRSNIVTLTKAGEVLAQLCAGEVAEALAPSVAGLSAGERTRLVGLLTASVASPSAR